jgi:hypothetical protein
MITTKNFWLWFGGIWIFCGSPFLIIGLYLGAQQVTTSKRLAAEGRTVEGMVLTKSITSSSSSSSGNSSTSTYKVTFQFLPPGGLHTGEAEVTREAWDSLIEQGSIRVTYVPDAPQHHRVEGQTSGWWLPGSFAVIGGMFTSLGGFVLLRTRSRLQTTRRLQREGITTTATISEIRAARIRINGVQQHIVYYQYQDERGRSYTGKETFAPEEAGGWKEGDRVTIRYDRKRPEISVWVRTA